MINRNIAGKNGVKAVLTVMALIATGSVQAQVPNFFEWDSPDPYTLDSGDLNTYWSYIGTHTSGTFIQNDGYHLVGSTGGGTLRLGWDQGSSGTYVLNGGTLNTGYTYVSVFNGTGTFINNGGTHYASTHLRLGGSGVYELNGGSLSAGQVFNNGTLRINGGTFSSRNGIDNGGTLEVAQGAGSTLAVTGYFGNTGTVNIAAGESVRFDGQIYNRGSFTGAGTSIFTGAYMAGYEYLPDPDDPYGNDLEYDLSEGMQFAGEVVFSETSALEMYLLGDGQSDWLQLNGGATLGGTLNLRLGIDEFAPEIGDSWDILVGSGITGRFDQVIAATAADWNIRVDYFDDRVTVTAVPIPAAVWLFGSALAGLGWLRRAPRAAPSV